MIYVLIFFVLLSVFLLVISCIIMAENEQLKRGLENQYKLDSKVFNAQCEISIIDDQARDLMKSIERLREDLEA